MKRTTTAVQHALEADRETIIEMPARAFQNDPAAVWLRPDPAGRAAQMMANYRWVFDKCAAGMRLTTEACEAASLWKYATKAERTANAQVSAEPGSPAGQKTSGDERMSLMMQSFAPTLRGSVTMIPNWKTPPRAIWTSTEHWDLQFWKNGICQTEVRIIGP